MTEKIVKTKTNTVMEYITKEEVEEERRMFYVAMTRARERLHIYHVKERYRKKQAISRFAEEAEG